jgi:hypothetical protein
MFGVDRFGTLLFFLLFAFLISDSGVSSWPNVVGSAANVGALIAGFTATGLGENRLRLGVLAAIGVTSAVLVGFDEAAIPLTIGAFGQAIVLIAILLAVVRRVLSHERVGMPTIAGAIAAYVLIGLIFAWIYLAMRGLFEGPVLDPDVASLPTYYSFEVLSTLGFGDITPVNDFVQRLTALEAMAGQIFLATLVARLVAMYGSSARSQ